jgi:hypothetical protein
MVLCVLYKTHKTNVVLLMNVSDRAADTFIREGRGHESKLLRRDFLSDKEARPSDEGKLDQQYGGSRAERLVPFRQPKSRIEYKIIGEK